jgi:hypothetical protein
MEQPLIRIAAGLDVEPALAEIARYGDRWLEIAPGTRQINLIGPSRGRMLESRLGQCWALVDLVHAVAVERHGDHGQIAYARIGLMRPGEGVPHHFDGMDGDHDRRYQIALQSDPGADVTVDDCTLSFAPGEAWWLDVSRFHNVHNGSDSDRIVILFDTKAQASRVP